MWNHLQYVMLLKAEVLMVVKVDVTSVQTTVAAVQITVSVVKVSLTIVLVK